MDTLYDPQFWNGLWQIIVVNILLSGDNAVVIALACRNLPDRYRNPAIFAGSAGAVVIRIVFCLIIAWLLAIPAIKLIGGLLLLWIGVKLMVPEHEDGGGGVKGAGNLWGAIQTIVIADVVMSLDNVIGIVAAAKGDMVLIVIGIVMSVPLIVFGSQLLLKVLNRFPILVIAGAGLLGWLGGEIIAGDVLVHHWIEDNTGQWGERIAAAVGAAIVVGLGLYMKRRAEAKVVVEIQEPIREEAGMAAEPICTLVPYDGSPNAERALNFALRLAKAVPGSRLEIANVQIPVGGAVSMFINEADIKDYHRDEGMKTLAPAIAAAKKAGVPFGHRIGVGQPGPTIAALAKQHKCTQIVMGTRGLGSAMGLLLGSVATDVIHHADVPITLVK